MTHQILGACFNIILIFSLRNISRLKFVATGEGMLVEHAVIQLQKISTAEEYDEKEGQYMNSLVCSRQCNDREVKLSLVQAIFLSLSIWCDNKLQDYHLHFNQVRSIATFYLFPIIYILIVPMWVTKLF